MFRVQTNPRRSAMSLHTGTGAPYKSGPPHQRLGHHSVRRIAPGGNANLMQLLVRLPQIEGLWGEEASHHRTKC